jgi:iron complex outermembrane receptor protein
MKSLFKPLWLTVASIILAFVALPASVAVAQQGADEEIEEIITTGTRRAARTASQSSVPIDVVSGADFENQGFPDMDDLLRNILPSYNVQRIAIGDAATLIRPATLRGLPPDNNLVLVNGKRRHRASVISESGSLAAGAQGADLASIPPMSIKQVEVLRDGASAQYGSDAIAGVINFVLRDDADGITVEARTGEFFEGDGTMVGLSANGGFPLGDDGFANITAQWREADPTSRSVQREDAAGLIAWGAPDQQANVRSPFAQIWGAPEIKNDWNVFLNSGIQLTDSQEVYLFGNVGERENIGGFFYRNPNNRGAVYHHTQGGGADVNGDGIVDTDGERGFAGDDEIFENQYRAIVDQDDIIPRIGGQVSPCPALVAPPGTPTAADAQEVSDDADARALLTESCWVMNKVVPGGYTPSFGGVMSDASAVLGIRGEYDNGMLYDFSGSIGRNETEFFLNNTWNPSRGPDAIGDTGLQRDFDIGSYTETDISLNADFVMPIAVDAFASDLNFAFGAEWRNEQFQVRVGEENSWQTGNFALQNVDPGNPNCYESATIAGECEVIRDTQNSLGNGINAPVIFDLNGDGLIDAADGTKDVQLVNLSIGAHGFAGFSPPQAGRFDRANYAVYVDLEADVTERFTAGLAVRFEDFDDFGTTTNGKVSARFAFTDRFAVRGSYSTGFRAPTPGQSNVTKVSTLIIDGELIQNGQIPPTNPIAIALGAEPLKPEDATNFTVGAVFDLTDSISVTLDYYNIVLEDRIAQTGNIDITEEDALTDGSCPTAQAAGANLALCLQESGVPGAADLTSLRFFTNDFETTTQGMDLVATWALDWGGAGSGNLTAAWNWTETEVDRIGLEVSRNRVLDLENQNPQHRGIFTYNHFIGNLRLMGRASYYGEWIEADFGDDPTWWANIDSDGTPNPAYLEECVGVPDSSMFAGTDFSDQCYPEQWIFDIEAGYSFNDTWTVIAGIQNVGDEFGPRNRNNGGLSSGDAFDEASPFGMDGGFWYFRLRADF